MFRDKRDTISISRVKQGPCFYRGLSIILCLCISCLQPSHKKPVEQVHNYVSKNIDSLDYWLNKEFIPVINTHDSVNIKSSFFKGRKIYKRIEFAVEYFFNNSARNLNGPPLPEIEAEEHIVIDPGGFQVIEEYLFPFDVSQQASLSREAERMKSILVRVKTLWESTQFRDDQVFDALRMECSRIITLGISGFDTPLSFKGIDELPSSLSSIRDVLSFYGDKENISSKIDSTINYAQKNNQFNSFNRAEFITGYMNPVTISLHNMQLNLGIPFINKTYAINGDIKTIFDSAAFNINYFAPDENSYATPVRILLGKRLFYDPVLSGNKKISCGSCHNPVKAFTDGLIKNKALASGNGLLPRNTPTLINAALQESQFYDMRSMYLEDQVKNVIENKDEIHGNMKNSAELLNKDDGYRKSFSEAFPFLKDSITERSIQVALACYIRSLTSFNSRFDKYMRGDYSQMNAQEITGFNLFMGKAKCGICHFMPAFNGTVPPAFTFTESEVIGVPADKNGTRLDPDLGRYAIYKIDNFKNAFKTPTVRNTELTAPYMHNGVYSTLDEVVEFYNHGGGAGLGLPVDNQTLPFDSLQLNDTEKKAVVAFMKTLTDAAAFSADQQ